MKEQSKEACFKDQQSVNNNYHQGITESPSVSGQKRLSFHRKHKKSLSDTFNPFQVRVPNDFLDLFKGSNDYSNNAPFLSTIAHNANNINNLNYNSVHHNQHDDATLIRETHSHKIQHQNHIEEIDELLQSGLNLNNIPVTQFNIQSNDNNSQSQMYNNGHQFQNSEQIQSSKKGQSQNQQFLNTDKFGKENQNQQINKINQSNGYFQNNQSNKLSSQNNHNLFGVHNKNISQPNIKQENIQNFNGQNQNNQMINKKQNNNHDENLGLNSLNSNNNSVSSDSHQSNLSLNSNQSQNFNDKLTINQLDQQNSQTNQGQIQQNISHTQLASTQLDFFQNNQMPNHSTINKKTLLGGGTPNLLQQVNPSFIPSSASINLLLPNFDQLQQQSKTQLNKSGGFAQSNSQVNQQQSQQQQQQQQHPQSQSQHYQQHYQGSQAQSNNSSINENLRRYMGSLKFFDENKNYGFIVLDDDNIDIFVHYDDLQKAGITKEFLKSSKQGNVIRFSFSCMKYIGKYKQSKKAVELQVMPYNPALSALRRHFQFSYISSTSNNTSNLNSNNMTPILNNTNNINTQV